MHRFFILILFSFLTQNTFAQCDTLQGQVNWRFWSGLRVFEWDDPNVDVDHMDNYPNGPAYIRTLYSLSAPSNYSDWYYSLIRGYIRTPVGGQVVFNLNGDDYATFKLSTDNTIDNLIEIHADTSDAANLDVVTLAANQYYYFELSLVEQGGSDYLSLEWKADFLAGGINAPNWTLVGGDYLHQACEQPCELRGTTCDDGDVSTTNDQYDGNCNCVGDPVTTNTCIGERGVVQAYRYEGLAGNNTDVLDAAITNGVQPDTVHQLGGNLYRTYYRNEGGVYNYGTYIQGYLSVPVSGLYSFNITGSHENHFYLSSDETVANKNAHHVFIPWWAGTYLHDNPSYADNNVPANQSEENIFLESGRYYYFEVRHKGAEDNWQNFHLYWKTPYQTRDQWLRLPTFYCFDYTCESACIKSGVACNDGDPYTANDQWNGNCNCSGTPCEAPNCDDPTTSYLIPDECETTHEVSNRADDAWLSCTPQSNAPNPARNGQHWIQYDFGTLYRLDASQVWNYNAQNATNQGFEQATIDYSSDGINWQELGTFNWSLAPGTNNYAGFAGPDFSGITAQYVLISSNDDPNSCRGLSKVAFNAVSCPNISFTTPSVNATLIEPTTIPVSVAVDGGEAAVTSIALFLDGVWIASDNAFPFTWTDLPQLQNLPIGDYQLSAVVTDANNTECELATVLHITSESNANCETTPISITEHTQPIYYTTETITSSSAVIQATIYQAGESITLLPGFDVQSGTDFTARIAMCDPASAIAVAQSRVAPLARTGNNQVKLFPNPVVDQFTLEINAHRANTLDVRIYDVLGKELGNFTQKQLLEKGQKNLAVDVTGLTAGLYYCKIKIGAEAYTRSFVRADQN
ncbi:MAG: PA14 domain-containing protein [Bacteroidota bacterium]